MASSKQKYNGGSMVTNESPHFMKIVLQETLQNGKLWIPIDFIKKYGKGISSPAFLRVPSGEAWKVELSKRDGKVWLKNGWQEFSKHYSLEHGQFVVFRYQGNSKFHVAILDRTATEIQYPHTSSNYHAQFNEIPEESETDDSIEIIEEIPPAPTRNFREKLQVPSPQPQKKMRRTNNSANKIDEVNLKYEGMAPQAKQNGGQAMKADESTKTLTAGEKVLALHRAAKAFQSKNPFFILVMQPSYVGLTPKCRLALPAGFVRKHLMKGDCEITLCNSNGKTWPVKLHQAQSERGVYAMLHVGWETFVLDNNLKLGDVYAFELINCNEITLKVVKCQVKDGDHRESSSWTDDFSPAVKRKAGTSSAEEESWIKLDKHEKAKALRLAKAFRSENPYFTVVMQPYYVHKHTMNIPANFTRRYFKNMQPKVRHEVLLSLSNGKSWPAVYRQVSIGNATAQLQMGWSKFVWDNNLEVGDVCVFELTEDIKPSINLKVTIYRKQAVEVEDSNLGSSCATARRGKRVKIEREESLEIDTESSLQNQHQTEEFHVPMKEGEFLEDFWLAEKIQQGR